MKRVFWFIAFFVMLSCNDDEAVSPEGTSVWQEHDKFLYDLRVQYNSYGDEDYLYLMGRRNFSYVTFEDDVEIVDYPVIWMEYDQHHKMPISSDFFVTANSNSVNLVASKDPIGGPGVWLNMEQMDPDFVHV